MAMFPESEFENACLELETPNVPEEEGWEFFTESHDVTIYRLYDKESGLYQYKIYGFLRDVNPEICAEVYMDLDYRRIWDSYVNELREVEDGDHKAIYWQVNFPFPMSNRDYVYKRELKVIDQTTKKIWVVVAQSAAMDAFPEKKGVIRVADYFQKCALTSDGQGGTKAYMWYYDNPGGSIPKWIINWAAKTGVPGFLDQMQKACRGYEEYCKNQKTQS